MNPSSSHCRFYRVVEQLARNPKQCVRELCQIHGIPRTWIYERMARDYPDVYEAFLAARGNKARNYGGARQVAESGVP